MSRLSFPYNLIDKLIKKKTEIKETVVRNCCKSQKSKWTHTLGVVLFPVGSE